MEFRAGRKEDVVGVCGTPPDRLLQTGAIVRRGHQCVPRKRGIAPGKRGTRRTRDQFLDGREPGRPELYRPGGEGDLVENLIEGLPKGLGPVRVEGRMPAVRGHPREVVRVAAPRFVGHGHADHVDVSQPRIRFAAIERQVRRLRLETRIPGVVRISGRRLVNRAVRTGRARAEPHPTPLPLPGGTGSEIEPGVVDALAGVEAVRDQDDHVLLARLEVRRGLPRDVARELVEGDPVRGPIGVDAVREFPEQGGPPRLRVAPGRVAEDPHAPAADPGHRDSRRAAGESRAHRRVRTDRPAGTAVLRRPELPESRQSPVHEGFARHRLQIPDHPPDHVLGDREPASAPHPDGHGLRGVEQDPDPGARGGTHDSERIPAFVQGALDCGRPGIRQDARRRGGERQPQRQREPPPCARPTAQSLHGVSPFTNALVALTAPPGGPRRGAAGSPRSSGHRCSRRRPVPLPTAAERAAGSSRAG